MDYRKVPWLLDEEEVGCIIADAGDEGRPSIITVDMNRDWPDGEATQMAEHIVEAHNAILTMLSNPDPEKGTAFMLLLQAHEGSPQKLADAWARLLWQADHPPGTDPDSTVVADLGEGWTMERDLTLDWELNAPAFRRLAAAIIRDLAKAAGYEINGEPT